jgi:hypothetical protein
MALSERTYLDVIIVQEDGILEARHTTVVERDGVVIAKSHHRGSFVPGDDLTNADDKIKDIAGVVWTPDVIEAYQEKMASLLSTFN